jgi:hypothetical protein
VLGLTRGGRRAATALGAAALLAVAPAPAAPRLLAGAAVVEVKVPGGTPLAGYGGFPRRAWIPDLLGRYPYAFWFRPSQGTHDPIMARGLYLESAGVPLYWLAVDLVGVDPGLVAELTSRMPLGGGQAPIVLVSASHTHAGPGAYADSELFGFAAVDRLAPAARAAVVDALARAARDAAARKGPAGLAAGRAEVTGVAESRIGAPLDESLDVLKVAREDGRTVAVLWNYAIHGTALDRANMLLSADVMGHASALIERAIDAPALFINGAEGDVSPRHRGVAGVRVTGEALAAGALEALRRARPEPDAGLSAVTVRVELPAPALSLRNCLGAWVPQSLRLPLGWALAAWADVAAVAIGRTAWVSIPGELETRLGIEIKAHARPPFERVLIAGLTNDHRAYFLTPGAYGRPSYVSCASLYGAEGGTRLRDGAVTALEALRQRLTRR